MASCSLGECYAVWTCGRNTAGGIFWMGTTLGWRWVIPEVFGVHRGFCLRLYWLFRYHWCWHVLTTRLWWYHREWAPRNDFGRWFSRGGLETVPSTRGHTLWCPALQLFGWWWWWWCLIINHDDDPGWWWCCCWWWSNYIIVFFRWFSSFLIYSILFGTFQSLSRNQTWQRKILHLYPFISMGFFQIAGLQI